MLKKNNKAIAALPTILILTVILVEITLTLAFLSYYLGWGESEISKSNKALYFAEAGIYDNILKIDRNLNFTCTSSTLSFGTNKEAEVTVQKDTPSSGQDTIYSIGKYNETRRKVKAIISIDQSTGKITIDSWREIEM